MPLTSCPECGRQISTAAEACPQCGHPMRRGRSEPVGPTCYTCPATATTRCQRCGVMSCAQHLNSIYVSYGKSGAYELRCESCYASAQTWQVVGWFMTAIGIIIVLIFWSQMGRR